MSSGSPVVVAVVVTYDAAAAVRRCVDSLIRHGGLDHVFVIDNGGRLVDDLGLAVTVLHPARNGGFGAGANVGFAAARQRGADVVILLNDDVVVTEEWLDPLVAPLLASTGVGATQPALVFRGTDPPIVNSLGVVIGPDGAGVDVSIGEPFEAVGSDSLPIEAFTGGTVALSAEFLAATKGFDERYFLYYEDVDLARRGARLGWSYRCIPTSVVEHDKGASSSALGERLVYLRERNRLWSAFRNEPTRVVAGALWLSVRRVRHHPRRVHARALVVGVGGGFVRAIERFAQR